MNPNLNDKKLNVVLADESSIYLLSLRTLIQKNENITLIGVCYRTKDIIPTLQASHIDILIIDFILFKENFIERINQIKAKHPNVKIIAVSIHDSSEYRKALLKVGVEEFFSKWDDSKKIIDIINHISIYKSTNIRI